MSAPNSLDDLMGLWLMKDALEYWDWIDHVKDQCLTIADITKLKHGERLPVLSIHRNLCDEVYPKRGNPKPALAATEFFKETRSIYVHEEGLCGRMEWHWDKKKKHTSELFEFEINYKPKHWYPLKNGYLPEIDPLQDEDYPSWGSAGRHWSEFPETTQVGWRGPMLLWDKLDQQPPVFTNVDMKRLAWFAVCEAMNPVLEQLSLNDRCHLRCTKGEWFLSVEDLTQSERELLEKRFSSITIQDLEDERSDLPAWGDKPCTGGPEIMEDEID
jgi:hypothetical protein